MTIGEILKSKGTSITMKDEKIKIKQVSVPAEPKTKCYAQMTAQFKHIDMLAKEQIQKALIGGADPEYRIKSSKELGNKEPNFTWVKGILTYIPNNNKKKKKTA